MRGLDFLWEIFCLQFSVQGYNDDGDDDIYYDEVCVCVFVTKNDHFLELPPSAPKL